MPEPAKYVGTSVYTSNFEQTISEWHLSTNSGAVASMQQNESKLEVNITTVGTSGWHIQLTKTNISLEAGKKYRLTFKAKSTANRSATSYVGMNVSPWSAYSDYNSISLTDTFKVYSYVFDMTTSDDNARIAFDLGTADQDIIFEYIKLESVELQFPTSAELVKNVKSRVFPNPANDKLFIDNADDFQELLITNINGQLVKQRQLSNHLNEISVNELSSGIYFVTLRNQSNRQTVKIIKK